MRYLKTLLSFSAAIALCSCSSAGIYNVRTAQRPSSAPTKIVVEPFSSRRADFQLGERSVAEQDRLRREIVSSLARQTAQQIRTHAAHSSVSSGHVVPGMWVVRGNIRKVDQGSRALRTGVGLGAGRTTMKTSVSVFQVTASGWVPLLSFKTSGASGLEPGVAPSIATGGISAVGTSVAAVGAALPGVNSDIDRTAYEISAMLSAYLQAHRLLAPNRTAIQPRMKGQLPTTIDPARAIPAPLRN